MKILIVDDDRDCLMSLEEILSTDHEVYLADDAESGLKIYHDQPLDLIITDYNMPRMNGIELLKTVHAQTPNMAVMILTGFAAVENAIDAVNHGAYAFFRKPLDVKDFMATLKELERELAGVQQRAIDQAQLVIEHSKLKNAYVGLLNILEKTAPPPTGPSTR